MRFPLNWAHEFVDLPANLQTISDRLTLIGYMTEHIDRVRPDWREEVSAIERVRRPSGLRGVDVVTLWTGTRDPFEVRLLVPESFRIEGVQPLALRVGRVTGVQPQKDEVSLITLEVGEAGSVKALRHKLAPAVGSQYAVLCVGRGTGTGKLASEADVGYTTNSDDEVQLPDYYAPGRPLHEEMTETVFDLEVRQNRPDCLGVYGLCRDLAAGLGLPLRPMPPADPKPANLNVGEFASLRVEAHDLCRRFAIQVIRGVKIGPSPRWLADRVVAGGMRSINNVVDLTNYVMLETGQPLHAFDYDKLGNRDIVIRRARKGEKMPAIDEHVYELDEQMLVVANRDQPLALAGIIGGKESEITGETVNILLDAAHYNQTTIRKTSRRLAVRTEASNRLEKYLDAEGVVPTLQRTTQLILELAGGQCCAAPLDVYEPRWKPTRIEIDPQGVRELIGRDYSDKEIRTCLERVGFTIEHGEGKLRVVVPSWRSDVTVPADVAEEVARIHGYEHVPSVMLDSATPFHTFEAIENFDERCREVMIGLGLDEVITDTLVDPDEVGGLYAGAPERGPRFIVLANPPSKELRVLRHSLMYNLLRTAMINDRAGRARLGFFELGKVFHLGDGPRDRRERKVLGVVLAGAAQDRSWYGPEQPYDFFHAKGLVEALLRTLGVDEVRFEPTDDPVLHPGRSAVVLRRGEPLGVLGQLHPGVRERLGMRTLDACLIELELERLAAQARPVEDYHNPYEHEALLMDLNVVVPAELEADRLTEAVATAGGDLLRSVRLIDVYTGEHVAAGRKSVTFSLRFQIPERTLAQEEVLPVMELIRERLADEFGAALRT